MLDWWDGSAFKKFYTAYLDPAVHSIQDLIKKIKAVWSNLSWDENKSFLDNMMTVWNAMADAIKSWWETSELKQWVNKLKDFGKNVKDAIVDWWNNSSIGRSVSSFMDEIDKYVQQLGNAVWDLPGVPLFRPFGFLIGKSIGLEGAEKEEYKLNSQIEKLEKKISAGDTKGMFGGDKSAEMKKELAKLKQERDEKFAAHQQVQAAMRPIGEMSASKTIEEQKLTAATEQIKQTMAEEKQKTAVHQAEQSERLKQVHESLAKLLAKPDPVFQQSPFSIAINGQPAYNPLLGDNR